jgi:hypothetical protein
VYDRTVIHGNAQAIIDELGTNRRCPTLAKWGALNDERHFPTSANAYNRAHFLLTSVKSELQHPAEYLVLLAE